MARSVQGMRVVSEGRLAAGLPYLRLGQGAPLVMALGGAAEHANPASVERRISMSTAARFAGHFTVYVTSRKPGLAAGATMADVAADYAKAITDDIGEPVAFYGTSAGGAVALQLATGFPHLVRRLVLAAAACRLSPAGRQLLAEGTWSRLEPQPSHSQGWGGPSGHDGDHLPGHGLERNSERRGAGPGRRPAGSSSRPPGCWSRVGGPRLAGSHPRR
jgi:pimeloyl-ACP methyl ester carboxylesterase